MYKNKGKALFAILMSVAVMAINCNISLITPVMQPVKISAAKERAQEISLPTEDRKVIACKSINEKQFKKIKDVTDKYISLKKGVYAYGDVLEAGKNHYAYNKLNIEQKKFYNKCYEKAMQIMNFSMNIDSEYAFSIDGLNIPRTQLDRAWLSFINDNPQFYFIEGAYVTVYNTLRPNIATSFSANVEPAYAMSSTRQSVDKKIADQMQEYKSAVDNVKDTYEKVRIIHDMIVKKLTYAYQSDGVTPSKAAVSHCITGFFDSDIYAAVCEGYTKGFSFILNSLGIPNVIVTGYGNGGAHAWNLVSFDDGKSYDNIDVTWDDIDTDDYTYRYFAMPKDIFNKSHVAESTTGTTINDWLYELPDNITNDMSNTYYVRYNSYAADITNEQEAKVFFALAVGSTPGDDVVILYDESQRIVIHSIAIRLFGLNSISYSQIDDYLGKYELKLKKETYTGMVITPVTKQPEQTTEPEPTPTVEPKPSKEPISVIVQTPPPVRKPIPKPTSQASLVRFQVKKGDTVTDKNNTARYTVTEIGKNAAVELTLTKKNSSKVTIPNFIRIKNKPYKVTSIRNGAFKNYTKLKSVTIGKNVKRIGKEAFCGCKNLKKVTVKSSLISGKMIGKNAFLGITEETVIKVPKNKVKLYKKLFRAKGLNKKVKVTA